jgi:hypothetical protein
MRGWQFSAQKSFIRVAGRAFVKGAFIPSVSLETLGSVRFAILIELSKQMKRRLKK